MPDFTYDDDDDLDNDGSADDGTAGQNSGPMNQIRRQLREAKKQLKEQAEALAAAQTRAAELEKKDRQNAVTTVASKLGLSEKQANRLLRLQPDVELTEEAIRAAAIEEEFLVPEAEEEAAPAPSERFRPVTGGGEPPQHRLTRDAWVDLQKKDPAAALEAYSRGLVDGLEELSPNYD